MRFTDEHQELRRTVSRFIEEEINPHIDDWEEDGIFPGRELFKKMGDLGLLGISKPAEYGGLGLDYSYEMVFCEELGAVRAGGVPMAIGVQTNMATPALARYGSDALRREFLAPAIAGDMICSIAVSEPHAGSDVAAIKTRAIKDGGDYVINGTKMWITNSTQADFLCLLANTEGDHPHKNKSLIIIPTDTPGISFSERLNKLGMRCSDTAQIFLDDVRVPQRHLIGAEGSGFSMQMWQFQEERLAAAMQTVKGLEMCIQETITYCRDRKIFGGTVLDNQVVQYRLAELQTEVEALRALLYQATETYVAGGDVTMLATMAKLKAGRLGREVSDACLQYWGGMGFMWDNIVSRLYRDFRLGSIGGGSDETMLRILSRMMGMG